MRGCMALASKLATSVIVLLILSGSLRALQAEETVLLSPPQEEYATGCIYFVMDDPDYRRWDGPDRLVVGQWEAFDLDYRGWALWDVSGIPDDACVLSATLKVQILTNYEYPDHITQVRGLTVDPRAFGDDVILYNVLDEGSLYGAWATPQPGPIHSWQLSGPILSELQTALGAEDWFGVALVGATPEASANFQAHNLGLPQLEVVYRVPPDSPGEPELDPPDPCSGEACMLSWDAVEGADEYELYSSLLTFPPNWNLVYEGAALEYSVQASIFPALYCLKARNACGSSDYGPSVSLVGDEPPDAPGAPGFDPAAPCEGEDVVVSWTAAEGAETYSLRRRIPPSATFNEIWSGTETSTTLVDPVAADYLVQAENHCGESDPSSVVALSIEAVPGMPDAPWFDPETPCAGDDVTFSWYGFEEGVEYNVYRDEQLLITLQGEGLGTGSLTTTAVAGDYQVEACNGCGCSSRTAPLELIVADVPAAPGAIGFSPSEPCAGEWITASWSEVEPGVTYELYYEGDLIWSGKDALSTQVYAASGSYWLRACNACGCGDDGQATRLSALSPPAAPAAPEFTPDPVCIGEELTVSWAEVPDATSYELFRDGAAYEEILGTSYSFVVEEGDLPPTGSWSFSLTAGNACGDSPVGAEGVIDVYTVPEAPGALGFATNPACEGSALLVTWEPVADAVAYRIYRDDIQLGGDYTELTAYIEAIAGDYTLTASNGHCWSEAGPGAYLATIDVPATPAAPLFSPDPACAGETVIVSWDAIAGATEYRLYRDEVQIADLSATAIEVAAVAGAYQVSAGNGECWSELGASAELEVLAIPEAPGVPLISPNPACSGAVVAFSWEPVPGATRYLLHRDGTSLAVEMAGTDTAFVAPSGAYALRAGNACGWSDLGSSVVLEVMSVPAAPGAPAVTPNPFPCGTGSLTASWSAVTGATRYQLFLDGGPIGGEVTALTASVDAVAGTYTLKAGNDCGWSEASAATAVTGEAIPETPLAPVFAVNPVCAGETVAISWTAVAGAQTYQLYLGGTPIGPAVAGLSTSIAAQAGAYALAAGNDCGWSGLGATSTLVTVATPAAPNPPTVDPNPIPCAATEVTVSWNAVADAATYQVLRDGVAVGSAVSGTSVTLTAVAGDYSVQAANACGTSAASGATAVVEAGVPAAPQVPQFSQNPACAGSSVDVSWEAVAEATSYRLYRDQVLVGDALTDVTLTLEAVAGDYAVQAGNDCGWGAIGTTATLATLTAPAAPSAPAVSPNPYIPDDTELVVSWTAVSGATQYQLYIDGEPAGDVVTAETLTLTPPAAGGFALKAGNACGWSALGAATAVTLESWTPTATEYVDFLFGRRTPSALEIQRMDALGNQNGALDVGDLRIFLLSRDLLPLAVPESDAQSE